MKFKKILHIILMYTLHFSLGWSAFNAAISPKEGLPEKSKVGYLQTVNESPNELRAMFTVLERSKYFAQLLALEDVDIVLDQACFAKACHIMWARPEQFANVICRLGSFHTVPVFVSVIFKRFGDAGLTDIIVEASIIANGSLAGVSSGKHYNRSIRCLKLVYEAMARLQWVEFGKYVNENDDDIDIDLDLIQAKVLQLRDDLDITDFQQFSDSETVRKLNELLHLFRDTDGGPMRKFWLNFLEMIELLLSFVRASRLGNWQLHLSCLRNMLPWFFAYDNTNYARYGTFYYCTMQMLEQTHPDLHEKLQSGHFSVQMSTSNTFGKIPEDQTIEETVNRSSKIPGGIIGKSTNVQAVNRWITTAADRAMIADNVKELAGMKAKDANWTHKEASPARIKRDEKDVKNVMEVVSNMQNPYQVSQDLTSISTGIKASEETERDLFAAFTMGSTLFQQFIEKRLISHDVDFFDTLSKQKLKTFTSQNVEKNVKVGDKNVVIKADRMFFCKLVVIAKMRDVDLYDVYSHELGPIPWAIATQNGTIYKVTKSLLLEELEKNVPSTRRLPAGVCVIIDAFATIQVLKKPKVPGEEDHEEDTDKKAWKPDTFADVAESILSAICNVITPVPPRIDFVIDRYFEQSIKRTERERRTKKSEGRRIKINSANQRAPAIWNDYMKNSANKEELPTFLVNEWCSHGDKYGKYLGHTTLYVCHGDQCSRLQVDRGTIKADVIPALTCNAEEADSRMYLHAEHISENNESNAPAIVIKSSDTDVLVGGMYHKQFINTPLFIQRQSKQKKWKNVSVSALCDQHGNDICNALPGFHAFTGCDSTSGFVGKGKKTCFQLLQSDIGFRRAMKTLGDHVPVLESTIKECEKAVCKLYKHKGDDVNKVRYDMLNKGAESFDVPPTKDALKLHTERSNYQAYIWKRSTQSDFIPCSPAGNGWKLTDGILGVHWMTQDPAPKSILELVSCKRCKSCSTRRCPCTSKGFKCTDSCGCDPASCENSEDSGRHIVGEDSDGDEDEDDE